MLGCSVNIYGARVVYLNSDPSSALAWLKHPVTGNKQIKPVIF